MPKTHLLVGEIRIGVCWACAVRERSWRRTNGLEEAALVLLDPVMYPLCENVRGVVLREWSLAGIGRAMIAVTALLQSPCRLYPCWTSVWGVAAAGMYLGGEMGSTDVPYGTFVAVK